jgi:hypothetical protein
MDLSFAVKTQADWSWHRGKARSLWDFPEHSSDARAGALPMGKRLVVKNHDAAFMADIGSPSPETVAKMHGRPLAKAGSIILRISSLSLIISPSFCCSR